MGDGESRLMVVDFKLSELKVFKDTNLEKSDLNYLRANIGIDAKDENKFVGKKLNRNIPKDTLILESYVE